MITYRFLHPNEYERLASTFKGFNSSLPDPSTSHIYAAIDSVSNEIVGFQVIQLQFHLEPIWIKESYRKKLGWRKLFKGCLDLIGNIKSFVSLDNDKMHYIASEMGYLDSGLKVYKKDVI